MTFKIDSVIDNRFLVTGICSKDGGMGEILFVNDTRGILDTGIVLKYCRDEDEENIKRFRREVRLLESFSENPKVVKVLHSNVEHDPPYFVMDFYQGGDLTKAIPSMKDNPEMQESIFYSMIDCISELHSNKVFHRDIKPQNFLMDNGSLIVSDFGLCVETNSSTRFTSTSTSWGTMGYFPPEFQNGGFKNADASGDIFMLGKSFYALITSQNPTYLMDGAVNPALLHVIQKSCELNKNLRYQSLAELKQALQVAFDVILGRGGNLSAVTQLQSKIQDRLENENKYNSNEVIEFITKLSGLEDEDQIRICYEIEDAFISILTQDELIPHLSSFISVYSKFVESNNYSWAYAETIAYRMSKIFKAENTPLPIRSKVLELAIDAAYRMNRFAAMDTCIAMIKSVDNESLGSYIASIIQKNSHTFVSDIEHSQCKCETIRRALKQLQKTEA